MAGEMRVSRIISLSGAASRRAAEQLILEGRVRLNGVTVEALFTKADPGRDQVFVDGKPVSRFAIAGRETVLLNKPRGYVSTRSDEQGRRTVMNLLPPAMRRLYPVGRLDLDTEGLLLMTNDGDLCHAVTHPRYGVRKVYEARVRGIPSAGALQALARGIVVDGELLKAASCEILRRRSNCWLRFELLEGKNREIRRLCDAIDHPVIRLRRTSIGFLSLDGVPPGRFRKLSSEEAEALSALSRKRGTRKRRTRKRHR